MEATTEVEADTGWRYTAPPAMPPILTAAMQVFLEKGYHGASVREIARRCNLTLPTLYYHYDNKEGLLKAVLLTSIMHIADHVERAAAAGGAPAERLFHVVENIVLAMTIDAPSAAIEAAEARYLGPENTIAYVAVRDRVEASLRDIISDGIAEGTFVVDDESEARRAILGLTQSIPRWYHVGGDATPQEIARRYARLVLRMVGVTPARG